MTKEYGYGGYSLQDFEGGISTGKSMGSKYSGKVYTSCYESHPVLKIGGGTLIGGSCISPVCKTADVYVGLDRGMRLMPTRPWVDDRSVQQILFSIQDMGVPHSAKDFDGLVRYLCNQLQENKTVHCGCIGGHGRTGMLFAAMFSVINGDKDAISSVRKMYCKKAVESDAQMSFLHKHYGITKVEPTKKALPKLESFQNWPKSGASEIKSKSKASNSSVFASATHVWNHVNSPHRARGSLF